MAQTGFPAYSKTAASNATADSAQNWAEGMAPSAVNDSARGGMASMAKWRDDSTNGSLVTGGTSTAYTVTTNTGMDALAANYQITFQVNADNGGTTTLNVDSKGAKPLRSAAGVELVAGQLKNGGVYAATYFTSNSGEWIIHSFNPVVLADSQVATAKIADNAVTLPKLVNATAQYKILARKSASSGNWEECSLSDVLDFVTSATRGDILTRGASTWGRLALGTSGQVIQSNGTDAAYATPNALLHVREEQSANTNSSSPFVGAAFNTYVLNTVKTNEISGASLSSNRITLPAGTYEADVATAGIIQASAGTSNIKARLRDVTNGATLLDGVNGSMSASGGGAVAIRTPVTVKGRFTLSGSVNIELQVYMNNTPAALSALNQGTEVYSDILIRKIA